jgi:hypothetical protein
MPVGCRIGNVPEFRGEERSRVKKHVLGDPEDMFTKFVAAPCHAFGSSVTGDAVAVSSTASGQRPAMAIPAARPFSNASENSTNSARNCEVVPWAE